VDKSLPICRALRWTPSELLEIESDIDAAVRLQEIREICRVIGLPLAVGAAVRWHRVSASRAVGAARAGASPV
jgi:hypothetical protein